MTSISYAITACNEHVELERLLNQLDHHIRDIDEVIIQLDTTATDKVREVCYKYPSFTLWEYALNKDFASFKNHLKSKCTKNYIFQIDADEYLSVQLLEYLSDIIELNPDIEVYAVPRINTVEGITEEHIKKWRWYINEDGWINYPDYQTRILKNIPEIYWVNKVHERLEGTRNIVPLPEGYDLIHPKTIERQELQNNFYNKI